MLKMKKIFKKGRSTQIIHRKETKMRIGVLDDIKSKELLEAETKEIIGKNTELKSLLSASY